MSQGGVHVKINVKPSRIKAMDSIPSSDGVFISKKGKPSLLSWLETCNL